MRFFFLLALLFSDPAYSTVEVGSGGGGVTTYANAGSLPATTTDGATAITLDAHAFYIYNLGSLSWILQTGSTGLAGPGTSVNNEIVLFSGTGGDTAKRATGTGVVHATSGVYGVGTVLVAEGGTGSSTAGGARTNLGAAASGANTDITSLGSVGINGASYTWPVTNGAADTYLRDNGSGILTWAPNPDTVPAIGGTLTGATAGSVLFSGSGTFSQNNAKFHWDDSSALLGIGTSSPAARLDVRTNLVDAVDPSFRARQLGTGQVGYMSINNVSNSSTAFQVDHSGVGVVAHFSSDNVASTNPVLQLSPASSIQPSLEFPASTGGAISIFAPATISSSYPLTLPAAQGVAASVLTNDGYGVLSWASSNSSSGTYTPALANLANLSSSTPHECTYVFNGLVSTISCSVEVTPTATLTTTKLHIDLPTPITDFTSDRQLHGVGSARGVAGQSAEIYADPTSGKAIMEWQAVDTSTQSMGLTFSYTGQACDASCDLGCAVDCDGLYSARPACKQECNNLLGTGGPCGC